MSQDLGPSAPNAAAKMNDTIVLNPPRYGTVPRFKKLPTEPPGPNGTLRVYEYQGPAVSAAAASGTGDRNGQRTRGSGSGPKFIRSDLVPGASQTSSYFSQTSPTSDLSTPVKAMTPRTRQSNHTEFENRFQKPYSTFTPSIVNLSAAPDDPVAFIWWIAQQITNLQTATEPSSATDISRPSPISMANATNFNHMGIRFVDPAQEKERMREENRERKKRWRESNAERNKDNDLRCRVTKLAKTRFGTNDSLAKRQFIEKEFYTRRSKREQKQRNRANQSGILPNFSNNSGVPKLQNELRSSLRKSHSFGVENVGNRLVDILLKAIESNEVPEDAIKLARTLREDMTRGVASQEELGEAMQVLSAHPELRRILLAGLNEGKEGEEHDASSADEGDPQTAISNGQSVPASAASSLSVSGGDPSEGYVRNLNAATLLLNDMAKDMNYASPYGVPIQSTPPPPSSPPAVSQRKKGKRPYVRKPISVAKPTTRASITDTAAVDALLVLAGVDNFSDDDDDDDDDADDDDKTIADPEVSSSFEFDFTTPGADEDVTKVIQHVANATVKKRLENEPATGGPDIDPQLIDPQLTADAFGAQPIREQAARLRDLYAHCGVSVNSIVPVAQAQALFQFYAHLIDPAGNGPVTSSQQEDTEISPSRPQTSSGLDPTSHASAKQNQQSTSRTTNTGTPAPLTTSSLYRNGATDVNEEEQKKIRSYGFPPLPGSKFTDSEEEGF